LLQTCATNGGDLKISHSCDDNGNHLDARERLHKAVVDIPLVAVFEGAEISGTPIRNELLDLVANQHAIRLLRAFAKIKSSSSQQALTRLAEEIAALTAGARAHSRARILRPLLRAT
jgi:hypothetical protein